MCKTCAHDKVCKDKGDYEAAKAALQQPRITTFKANLTCDNYAVDQWDGDVIVPSRDLPDQFQRQLASPNVWPWMPFTYANRTSSGKTLSPKGLF